MTDLNLTPDQLLKLRRDLGLPDQDFDTIIDTRTRAAISKALGLQKTDFTHEMRQIAEDNSSRNDPADPGLQSQRDALEAERSALAAERSQAHAALNKIKRETMIHQALGAFQINPANREAVTNLFTHGRQELQVDDAGDLIHKTQDGPKPGSELIAAWFEQNRWALDTAKNPGTGATGGGGTPAPQLPDTSTRAGRDQIAIDLGENPKEAEARLNARVEALELRLHGTATPRGTTAPTNDTKPTEPAKGAAAAPKE